MDDMDTMRRALDQYEFFENASECDITDAIRAQTEQRYDTWLAEKQRVSSLRELLFDVRGQRTRNPARDAAWCKAVVPLFDKYSGHRRACATGYPMTLSAFQSVKGVQPLHVSMSPAKYRGLLLEEDPTKELAQQFSMSLDDVLALKKPLSERYCEWTLLARVVNKFEDKSRQEGAPACVEYTVHLIDSLLEKTPGGGPFKKTKVKKNGVCSYTVSLFEIDVEEVAAMIQYMRDHSNDTDLPRKILASFERIWHFPIPEVHREEWLNVDPRESVVRLLNDRE